MQNNATLCPVVFDEHNLVRGCSTLPTFLLNNRKRLLFRLRLKTLFWPAALPLIFTTTKPTSTSGLSPFLMLQTLMPI